MVKKIRKWFQTLMEKRTGILLALFLLATCILLYRLFSLQIIHGEEYANDFNLKITKTRTLKSTRGNIYDRNGNVLAYNQLSNSVTLEDNGTYSSTRQKNLQLNGEIYRLIKMIENNGDSLTSDFHVEVDENNNFIFNLQEGTSLNRFRADVYGRTSIDKLSEEEKNATADDIMNFLMDGRNRDCFGIIHLETPYSEEELAEVGLPAELTKQEQLQIVIVRYQLRLTSFMKYVPVTVATNVSDRTVAAIKENKDVLQGVDIQEDSVRVYTDAEYFASILGYTGKPSAEELEELQEENRNYSSNSIIGKSGIEKYMETTLQGSDGLEKVTVDSLGKVLQIDEASRINPIQGNDVYLSIDKELQEACYRILEQRIAGILVNMLSNIKSIDKDAITDNSDIPIPIYDVYTALIENSVINIDHFKADDATDLERSVQQKFEAKQQEIFSAIQAELTGAEPKSYNDLNAEMQEYMTYIVSDMLMTDTGILSSDKIEKNDTVYQQWRDGSISLQEYLTYAASQNWIDITQISDEKTYLNSTEVYHALATYISDKLSEDTIFSKRLYHYMLMDDSISGYDICNILYDQSILTKEDDLYQQFMAGSLTPFDLLKQKINKLEITPAQLALDPCSGSVVITDPNTGKLLACVSYPGYDNNRLANQMDTAYFRKLNSDLSSPFYNKATQQRTAPGSTFKLVTTAAGLTEGVIDASAEIDCTGIFGEGLVDPTDYLKCVLTTGHGSLDVVNGIKNSCNVYFCTVLYRLGLEGTGENTRFSQNLALSKIQQYADMFELGEKTGIEISESKSQISQSLPIPSAIGQGTHSYTTVSLARYVSTLENKGTNYKLSLLNKVTDSSGNVIEEIAPQVTGNVQLADSTWNIIHQGMGEVVKNIPELDNLPIEIHGKTGTAQESDKRPNHGLFIGFSHGEGQEDIAMAIRIPYGYSSTNAAMVAKDILSYYYNLKDETEVLTGTADQEGITNESHD